MSAPRTPLSKRTRFEVLERDGFRCRYCGAEASEARLHVDHRHPRSRGGSDKFWNLVTACADCNLGKGASLPESFIENQRELAETAVVFSAMISRFREPVCVWDFERVETLVTMGTAGTDLPGFLKIIRDSPDAEACLDAFDIYVGNPSRDDWKLIHAAG